MSRDDHVAAIFPIRRAAEEEVLVVVKAHEHKPLFRQIFTRHDGRLLTDGTQFD